MADNLEILRQKAAQEAKIRYEQKVQEELAKLAGESEEAAIRAEAANRYEQMVQEEIAKLAGGAEDVGARAEAKNRYEKMVQDELAKLVDKTGSVGVIEEGEDEPRVVHFEDEDDQFDENGERIPVIPYDQK